MYIPQIIRLCVRKLLAVWLWLKLKAQQLLNWLKQKFSKQPNTPPEVNRSEIFFMNNSNQTELRAKIAALVLPFNKIEKIVFFRCCVDDATAIKLARALEYNFTVTHLDLSDNNITDIGAQALAKMLEKNRTLRVLNLGINKITDIGIKYLSNALKINNCLRELYVGYGRHTIKGLENLLETLKFNAALDKLGAQLAFSFFMQQHAKINSILTIFNQSIFQCKKHSDSKKKDQVTIYNSKKSGLFFSCRENETTKYYKIQGLNLENGKTGYIPDEVMQQRVLPFLGIRNKPCQVIV